MRAGTMHTSSALDRHMSSYIRSLVFFLILLAAVGCAPVATPGAWADPTEDAGLGEVAPAIQPTSSAARPTATVAPPADAARPEGWDAASHGSEAAPDYAVVMPQDRVNEILLTIEPEDWEAMQANLAELMGQRGTGGRGGFGGGMSLVPENPMWVEATLTFNGQTWRHVGVRYKGNSSLASGWRSGTDKLPLKLDFDEFEDEYPEIKNQRFYGFKQLSLANGFADETYMRDPLAYALLEAAGLPASRTAYYAVTLDYGQGPVDLGLYVAIEVVDDTAIPRYFGSSDGNMYEADGAAASLAAGTRSQISASFLKENNAQAADWGDIEALYDALHADERTTDAAEWRAGLEKVFDVDTFLKWLALAGAMKHWDTYGAMSHNYYLYDNPATGQLTWISWDHNQVFGDTPSGDEGRAMGQGQNGAPPVGDAPDAPDAPMPGGRRPFQAQPAPEGRAPIARGPGGRGVSLGREEVGDDWPLIRYLLDDPVYHAAYLEYMAQMASLLEPAAMEARIERAAALIAPYAEDEDAFADAVAALSSQVAQCYEEAMAFVASQ